MEFAYTLDGSSPIVKKYLVDAGTINVGVPVQGNGSAANAQGVIAATETVCVGSVGVSLDSATSTDAQTGTTVDNGQFISVIVNPGAVWRAKLSGGVTEDTTLVIVSAAQAASSGGTVVTGATDEFTVWGYTGANSGKVRRCDATAQVALAFPFAIAALDEFVETSSTPLDTAQGPKLTAAFTQVEATGGVAASDNFVVVEQILNDSSKSGLTNSYTFIKCSSHMFLSSGTLPS